MKIPEMGSIWRHKYYCGTYVRATRLRAHKTYRICFEDAFNPLNIGECNLPAFLEAYDPTSRLEVLVVLGEYIED